MKLIKLVPAGLKLVESMIRLVLESRGFVRVENRKGVVKIRLLTQRCVWALKGLDWLLDLPERQSEPSGRVEVVPPRLVQFRKLIEERGWRELSNDQVRGVLECIWTVPSRRKLLEETLDQVFSSNVSSEKILSARKRLETMIEVMNGKEEKPREGKRAIILTQTALVQGEGEDDVHFGWLPDSWIEFGVKLARGALPRLGAAVVYSELMNTGQFSQIEFADFRDEKVIQRLIERKEYDLVLISGATTVDRFLIDKLNRRLSTAGLTVINGGIGATIAVHPERYLENGASVFVGEFEGAAEVFLERLARDPSPTIFIRGREGDKGKRLRKKGYRVTVLEDLPSLVDMEEVYSVERERAGYLRRRLEALAMMRTTVTLDGAGYELPPSFRLHETNVSYGCPNACVFCATVRSAGRGMRARTLGSISQEWTAVEAPHIVIVDQNLTANGRDFVEALLEEARRLRKKVAFAAELNFFCPPETERPKQDQQRFFFDGSEDDERREKLLEETVTALQVGLEQPVKVKGARFGSKDPHDFAAALKKLQGLGLVILGTAMIGLPRELWSKESQDNDLSIIPYEDMSVEEWEEMLSVWTDWFNNRVPAPGAIPVSFKLIPGIPAFDILQNLGMLRVGNDRFTQRGVGDDFPVSLNPNPVEGIDSQRAVEDLRRRLYSLPSILKRMRAARLPPMRFVAMLLFNIVGGKFMREKEI